MKLSDAGLRRRPTKLLYPDHRLPPWLTEDATRDRSNRLLEVGSRIRLNPVRLRVGVGDRNASRSAKGRKDLREWYPHQPPLWFNEVVTPRSLGSLEI